MEPSLSLVAELVHTELIRVMPHEHTGLAAIHNFVTESCSSPNDSATGTQQTRHAGSILGRLPLDLGIHPAGHLDFVGGQDFAMQLTGQQFMAPPPGAFSAECSTLTGTTDDGNDDRIAVNVSLIWDSRAAFQADVDALADAFRGVFSE